jgi:adhesin transport system outer membrane protein
VIPAALEDAVNIVTRTYPTTLSARAALRAAAADLQSSRLERLPSISGNATWRYNLSADTLFRTSDPRPVPQLQVDLPIWSGGRIEADIKRTLASRDQSSASYLDTVNSLALTTVQTYFDVVRLTQREQFLIGSLGEHRRLVGTIDRRVNQDVSPLADLELARSRTAQVEQDLNLTHAQRLTSLRIMAQLIADAAYDVGPVPWYDPQVALAAPEVLEEQTVVFSPLLRRLEAETGIARAQLASRRAALFPQLDAEYSYDETFGHRVGGVLRVQNDATQLSQISAARIRIEEAEQNRRGSEVELRREVASDLIEFDAARTRAVVAKAASDSAARVSESFMRQFIAGRRSWLDVMNQLRESVSAQISQSEAEVSVMYTAARLTIESGRWRPKFDAAAAP